MGRLPQINVTPVVAIRVVDGLEVVEVGHHQGRVSDHRIGLTLYKIEQIMNGALDEVIDALITADTAEKLKAESDA